MRSKLGRSDCVQEDAHVGGALCSERLELPLRVRPSLHSVPEMGFAGAVTRSPLLRRSWLPCSAMTRPSRSSGRMLRPSVYR
jgi:hypothetical protein